MDGNVVTMVFFLSLLTGFIGGNLFCAPRTEYRIAKIECEPVKDRFEHDDCIHAFLKKIRE